MIEKICIKDNKCRGGFRFTKMSCGPQLPIIREGSAPSPISTTKYWLSLGSVPILKAWKWEIIVREKSNEYSISQYHVALPTKWLFFIYVSVNDRTTQNKDLYDMLN